MNRLITFLIKLSFISILSLLFSGCAYQNRTKITHLAELNGKLYIATADGAFKAYDIGKDKFNVITIPDARITKILPSDKNLIIEATSIGYGKAITNEDIYSLTEQDQFINVTNLQSEGFKQYNSSLITSDNMYLYAVKNDLIETSKNKYEFVLHSFRYKKHTGDKIKNHFDKNTGLIVGDTCDDNNYYWYACYINPVATHWTTLKGNLALVRKDKITNEQKVITLGDDTFERNIFISSDSNNVWVFGENWYKNNVFKISKASMSYDTLRMPDLTSHIKPTISHNDSAYEWLISSKAYNLYLERFDKTLLKAVQIPLKEIEISEHRAAVEDDRFIWVGASQLRSFVPAFPERCTPYLLRVSKADLSTKIFPVETTFGEGISNIWRSFLGDIAFIFFAVVGGPG